MTKEEAQRALDDLEDTQFYASSEWRTDNRKAWHFVNKHRGTLRKALTALAGGE